jgi:hypothetical protein
MLLYAANPAPKPHLALISAVRASGLPLTGGCGGERPSLSAPVGQTREAAMLANLLDRDVKDDFGPACVSQFVSRSLLGHCFGAYPAPCGAALFCFGYAALQVTVSVPDPP